MSIPKNAMFFSVDADALCTICGVSPVSSWDHVPPTKALEHRWKKVPYDVVPMLQALPKEMRRTENGVAFRTVCKHCNNTLGNTHDKELCRLADYVRRLIRLGETFLLPQSFAGNVESLIKAVFGHLLAAFPRLIDHGHDAMMRDYYLGKAASPGLRVYFWISPRRDIRIFRHFFVTHGRPLESVSTYCHLLEFYPFGFLVTDVEVPFDSVSLDEILVPGDSACRIPMISGGRFSFDQWWQSKVLVLLNGENGYGVHAVPSPKTPRAGPR